LVRKTVAPPSGGSASARFFFLVALPPRSTHLLIAPPLTRTPPRTPRPSPPPLSYDQIEPGAAVQRSDRARRRRLLSRLQSELGAAVSFPTHGTSTHPANSLRRPPPGRTAGSSTSGDDGAAFFLASRRSPWISGVRTMPPPASLCTRRRPSRARWRSAAAGAQAGV
jgi:hypothetical protein